MADSENVEPTSDSAEKSVTDNPEETFPPASGETESATTESAPLATDDLGQRIVDIALGTVVVTGELTIQAAKYLMEHCPELLDTLEAKGRPVREQIDRWLTGGLAQSFQTASTEPTPAEPSADDEISALERRVRELEVQVAQTPPPVPPVPVAPDLEDMDAVSSEDSVADVDNSTAVAPPSDSTKVVDNNDKEGSV